MNANSSVLFGPRSEYKTPWLLLKQVMGRPEFREYTKEKKNKKTGKVKVRVINDPNKPSRDLHAVFLEALRFALYRMNDAGKYLRMLQSATAFKKGSWHVKNAKIHLANQHFYVTDIRDAYGNVDLGLLSALLVYIFRFEVYKGRFENFGNRGYKAILHSSLLEQIQDDPLYAEMYSFLRSFFSGKTNRGLVFDGIASPYLFNLYLEAFLDDDLRFTLDKRGVRKRITYTRFADDLVFSSKEKIDSHTRRRLRWKLGQIGLEVQHRKSFVLDREKGTVFITKVGLHQDERRLVFPGDKRAALHNMLHRIFQGKEVKSSSGKECDPLCVVSGHVAEFLGYVASNGRRGMPPTKADEKMLALCKKFEIIAGPRRKTGTKR
jgi:hypothetical protein